MKSKPPDRAAMEERADAARLRELLGEPLDETDQRILAFDHGFGCHACPLVPQTPEVPR